MKATFPGDDFRAVNSVTNGTVIYRIQPYATIR